MEGKNVNSYDVTCSFLLSNLFMKFIYMCVLMSRIENYNPNGIQTSNVVVVVPLSTRWYFQRTVLPNKSAQFELYYYQCETRRRCYYANSAVVDIGPYIIKCSSLGETTTIRKLCACVCVNWCV